MAFPDLRNNSIINRINHFLTTPAYIMAVSALSLLSSLFSWELQVYSIYALIVLYCCTVGHDLLPVLPLVGLCYIAPSAANNPGRNGSSVFSPGSGGSILPVLIAVMVMGLVFYLLRDRCKYLKQLFTCKRKLLWGMLLLWAAYMLSGLMSPAYTPAYNYLKKNLLFSALQGAAVTVPYWLFTALIDWEKARKDYLSWAGVGAGFVIVGQFLWIYATEPVIQNGVIDRNMIFTGWGMYNNMGGMLAMMIPFAFHIGHVTKKGWLGALFGTILLGGVFLSNSRNSMLASAGIYGLCILIMFFTARNKKRTFIIAGILLVCGIAGAILFREKIFQLFENILSKGTSLNHRDLFYEEGTKQFVQYPIFGGSFYPLEYEPWSWSKSGAFKDFFPGRWHNTIIQLLACTGTVGLVAYLIHRLQTVRLFIKSRSSTAIYIGFSVAVLLFTSLFDCHFFNIGPTLFYSASLAFAEKHKRDVTGACTWIGYKSV